MDTIGKIFAFIVLVCAVAFVSAAYVLTEQTKNWKAEKEKVEKELGDKITGLEADKTRLQGEVEQAQNKQRLSDEEAKNMKARADERETKIKTKDLQIAELNKTDAELRATLLKNQETIDTLTNDKNALQTAKDTAVTERTAAVAAQRKAENELAACQDTLGKTQKILTAKTTELNDAKLKLDRYAVEYGDAGKRKVVTANVQPLIKGAVMKADNDSGLVMVSVGKDDGVKKGMTFEVVRPPSKYVGRIMVDRVDDEIAYCRIDPSMTEDPIEEGDYVATRLQ